MFQTSFPGHLGDIYEHAVVDGLGAGVREDDRAKDRVFVLGEVGVFFLLELAGGSPPAVVAVSPRWEA